MAKQINYMKKDHVTCQIHTLFYVWLCCWNWILKTLYIINTFQASSFSGFLLRHVLMLQKSNKLLVCYICSRFNLTLLRVDVIQLGVPSHSQWIMPMVRITGKKKRRKEKNQPHFPFKTLSKRTPWWGLKRPAKKHQSSQVGGEKYTWRVFISAQINGTWKKGEIRMALSRKQVPRRHLKLEKYNWKRSDKHLSYWCPEWYL